MQKLSNGSRPLAIILNVKGKTVKYSTFWLVSTLKLYCICMYLLLPLIVNRWLFTATY